MTLCPIALAVGCEKCAMFKICPLKTVIGDQKKLKGFAPSIKIDEKAMKKFLTPEVKPLFDKLVAGLMGMDEPLDHDAVEALFKQTVEEAGLKLGKLAQPVRVALTGKTASPGIFDVVLLLGKQKTVERLRSAVHIISTFKE